jgi:GAF domain-containing protein
MRGEGVALLSLQWKSACTLRDDELVLLHLAAQQIGLAIACNRSYQPLVAA